MVLHGQFLHVHFVLSDGGTRVAVASSCASWVNHRVRYLKDFKYRNLSALLINTFYRSDFRLFLNIARFFCFFTTLWTLPCEQPTLADICV